MAFDLEHEIYRVRIATEIAMDYVVNLNATSDEDYRAKTQHAVIEAREMANALHESFLREAA